MSEEIDPEIAAFYANMEVPDSIPVAGWTLEVPNDSTVCFIGPKRVYMLTHEAQEWCDENMREPYWFLGMSLSPNLDVPQHNVHGRQLGFAAPDKIAFYFTSEADFIHFKMRWG